MAFQQDLAQLVQFQKLSMPLLNMGLLVFCRTVPFVYFAPIFNRRDIPSIVKINFSFLLSLLLVFVVPPVTIPSNSVFILLVFANVLVGAMHGILLDWVLQVLISAGAIVNNQIGLSAASVFDPARRTQTAVLEGLFVFIVGATFISMGGLHWLLQFLVKTFTLFPLNNPTPNIFGFVGLEYWINLAGDTIKVGVSVMAAAFIGTLFLDVVLGVVNKSAQQIPVFQLSNSIKPVVGIAILLLTLPLFVDSVQHHITRHLRSFGVEDTQPVTMLYSKQASRP